VIQLAATRASDRRLAESQRSLRACAETLSRVLGREIEVTLADTASTPPADDFTESVRSLFDAREEGR
jgi:hypothetical protein